MELPNSNAPSVTKPCFAGMPPPYTTTPRTFDVPRPLEHVRKARKRRQHHPTVYRGAPVVDNQHLTHPRPDGPARGSLRQRSKQGLSGAKG